MTWRNADGKLVKSAPQHVKKAFAREIRAVGLLAKELEEAYKAQRVRLESSFVAPRSIPLRHWRQYYVEHPLLGFLGRRLIWASATAKAGSAPVCGATGKYATKPEIPWVLRRKGGRRRCTGTRPRKAIKVRLWHPLTSDPAELQRWRERIFRRHPAAVPPGIPRVLPGDGRRATDADVFQSLCRNLLAAASASQLVPRSRMGVPAHGDQLRRSQRATRKLPQWNMQAELHVTFPRIAIRRCATQVGRAIRVWDQPVRRVGSGALLS